MKIDNFAKFVINIVGNIMFKVNNEFQNANVPKTIRFTEALSDELSDTAFKKNISLNLLVLQCCRYALDHMETEED